ncbi:MAG: rnd [Alphaproteobacteria bacterium]|nr:rnd [Alphaproteobacteria bacterium]
MNYYAAYSAERSPMTQETIIPITDSAALTQLCRKLAHEAFITVDTEFMRERTYYPQLCLVQVAGETDAAVIDALAPGLDWTPFWELMQNRDVLKIFHAPRQDIEIFVKMSGAVPAPVFDTQIAAMACGFPDQTSYARLSEALTGTVIDKQEQFTDWTARPLRPAQLIYALQDVTILRKVYEALQKKLSAADRHEWLAEDMDQLNDINYYRVNPDDAWERLKLRSNRPASWAALKSLAAWREREAMRLDRPRQMILKDDVLTQLAMSVPNTQEALVKTRGIPNNIANNPEVLAMLVAAKQAKNDAIPKRTDAPSLTPSQEDQMELLKMALKIIARQQNVSPKLIAHNEDLNEFLLNGENPVLSTGWRKDIFGRIAGELLQGAIGMKIKEGRLILE